MPVTNLQIVPDEVDDTDGTYYFHYTWSPVTQDVNGCPAGGGPVRPLLEL
jgi:hypothetical protein